MTSQAWWTGTVPPAETEPDLRFVQNVRSFGAVGDGATNDTVAIQAALDAVAVVGGAVYFPPGSYLVKSTNNTYPTLASALVLRGSNIRLYGDGPSSIIFNDDAGLPAGTTRVGITDVLRIDPACSYVVIENLGFSGRNSPFGGVYPYNSDPIDGITYNLQAAIADRGIPSASHHIMIRGVTFRNLYNHCIRTGHTGEHHWSVIDCDVSQCTNGMNVNGDDSIYQGGVIDEANGIECAGDRCRIIGVAMQNGSGVSVGGSGFQTEQPQVVGCRFKNILGSAIGIAGCTRGVIADNIIDGVSAGNHGIFLQDVGAFATPCGPNIIKGNVIRTVAGDHGIWCQTAAGSIISGNDVDAGVVGIYVQCANVQVHGNRISGTITDFGATNYDGLRYGTENILANGTVTLSGTTVGAVLHMVGAGVPALALPNGSTWHRTDGTGPNFYVRENGIWVPK